MCEITPNHPHLRTCLRISAAAATRRRPPRVCVADDEKAVGVDATSLAGGPTPLTPHDGERECGRTNLRITQVERGDQQRDREGLGVLPGVGVRDAEVGQQADVAAAVADLSVDGERQLVVRDRRGVLPELVVAVAQVSEHLALASPVAELERDGERLILVLDRLNGTTSSSGKNIAFNNYE